MQTQSPDDPASPSKPAETKAVGTQDAPKKPERFDVDYVPAKQAEQPETAPGIAIDVPGYEQFIPAQLFEATQVRYKIKAWDAMPSGSYVQFILDNKPFRPVTDPKDKIMLSDLAAGPLAQGEHVLVAFACLPNHQIVKAESAIAVRHFFFGKRDGAKWNGGKDPLLILASPAGTYTRDQASQVMVDWFLLNGDVSAKGYTVRTVIQGPGVKPGGIKRVIDEWAPWAILSAVPGEYTVTAELLDSDGEVVTNPWSPIERKFTVSQ